MKAVYQRRYGSADVLELRQIETPVLGEDGVLVRVHAAGVDPGVWHLMTGLPYLVRVMGYGLRAPKARVPGLDVSGRVEAVGAKVTRFQPGDEVLGTCAGSFAELASAREDELVLKPAGISFEQAAALPTSATAALQSLRDAGKVRPGQKVLIIGASGGVGTFAVQLAKALGAEVTGICSTAKVEMVRSIGADHVIDYTRDDLSGQHRGHDVVLDLAGNRPLSRLKRLLVDQGTLVIVGGEGGGRWLGGVDRQLRALLLSPLVSQRLVPFLATPSRDDLIVLKELVESGKVTPVLDRSFELERAPEAIRYLEAGHSRGKVVLRVASEDR